MKPKLLLFISFALCVIVVTSCTKEGPEGPAGKDGNANVKSTTITFSNWSWDATNNYEHADFEWSGITSSIASTGSLLIYVNTAAGWAPLPRTVYPSTSYSESQRYVYYTGGFKIIVQDSDLLPPVPDLSTWVIKVVAIESTTRMKNPNVDWNDYEQVKNTFGLPD